LPSVRPVVRPAPRSTACSSSYAPAAGGPVPPTDATVARMESRRRAAVSRRGPILLADDAGMELPVTALARREQRIACREQRGVGAASDRAERVVGRRGHRLVVGAPCRALRPLGVHRARASESERLRRDEQGDTRFLEREPFVLALRRLE